ncbi:MAG: peptide chain release factor N(5)-glutamine methyltransferase [Flavobacteriales bacterium]|nr:peptide chain release factor N(5)-glutamine methyltransferase [Flavobacteriales bacterium]
MYSTLRGLKQHFAEELSSIYSIREAEILFFSVMEYVLGQTKTEMLLHFGQEISENQQAKIDEIVGRLKQHEPIQYITSQSHFYGNEFYVNPSVLIPRPETEELVHLILTENETPNLSLLDIGTGSGIIPITIAQNRKTWVVLGCDISLEALEIAGINNKKISNGRVELFQENILQPSRIFDSLFDIIVSNPPYVLESDKNEMSENVLNFEPHLALFVPNEDPLLFYRAILSYAQTNLKPNGKIYFEIHEQYAEAMSKLFSEFGFENIRQVHDMQGKVRIVTGVFAQN